MTSPLRTVTLSAVLCLATIAAAGCSNVEEKLATSPLIGAERIKVSGTGKVAVVDTETLRVIRQVDAGATPFWIAVAENR